MRTMQAFGAEGASQARFGEEIESAYRAARDAAATRSLLIAVAVSLAFCSVVFAACSAVCRARSKKSALPQTKVASKRVAPRATMMPIRLAGITGCAVTTDQGLDVITDTHRSRSVISSAH